MSIDSYRQFWGFFFCFIHNNLFFGDFSDVSLFFFVVADSKDDLMSIDSDKFTRIINEVENLHQHGKSHMLQPTLLKFMCFS